MAAACGGNVIVDASSGGGGAGGGAGGVATGGTTSPTTTTGITTDPTGTTIIDCPQGYTPCFDQYCADLAYDNSNCGGCGNVCEGGSYCNGGSCYFPPDCVTCGVFLTDGQGELCPGYSTDLYDSLVNCVCAGACAFQCSDNICTGQNVTPECQNCVVDTAAGCGNEFNECANDI